MNEDNKKQVILVSVLGVILVGVLVWVLFFQNQPGSAPTTGNTPTTSNLTTPGGIGKPATAQDSEEIDVKKLLAGIEQIAFDYESVKLDRPPMMPLAGLILGDKIQRPLQPIITKKVTGIVWNQYNPVAVVVDGKDIEVVGVGHEFDDGVIVDSIERDSVSFKIGEAKLSVELKEQ